MTSTWRGIVLAVGLLGGGCTAPLPLPDDAARAGAPDATVASDIGGASPLPSMATGADGSGDGVLVDALAILGVASAPDTVVDADRSALALEMARLLRVRRGVDVLTPDRLRAMFGDDWFVALQRSIARERDLDRAQTQRLMAARLPTPRALAIRITENRVVPGDTSFRRTPRRAETPLSSAETLVLTTRRHVAIEATLLDLRSGRILWQQRFRAAPERRVSWHRYRGDSFGGSVAAELATVLRNGTGRPLPPVPPAVEPALHRLLDDVAAALPVAIPGD